MKDTISSLKEIAEDREISLSYNVQDNILEIKSEANKFTAIICDIPVQLFN
nr:hypothetical protein [Orientia tsutsugamushi]